MTISLKGLRVRSPTRETSATMSSTTNEIPVAQATGAVTARRFLILVLFVSIAPIVFFTFLHSALPGHFANAGLQLFGFLAVAHVPITLFFWIDPRYRAHINKSPMIYYGLPLSIIAGSAAIPLAFGRGGVAYLFLFYFVWLLWHYGKQNWGILCLFAVGTKSPMPTKLERWICNAAPVAGVMGGVAALAQAKSSVFSPILQILFFLGAAATSAVVIATIYVAAKQIKGGYPPLRIAMMAVCGLFFVPAFFNTGVGVLAYGSAHAAQYFVIMYALAADRKQKATALRLGSITLLAVVGFFAATSFNNAALWGAAAAVAAATIIGITISHFVLDSYLWRLREPFQRGAVKESFDYLFH